eukprot:40734-Eustigmatos_ZCMA.PRE.1
MFGFPGDNMVTTPCPDRCIRKRCDESVTNEQSSQMRPSTDQAALIDLPSHRPRCTDGALLELVVPRIQAAPFLPWRKLHERRNT